MKFGEKYSTNLVNRITGAKTPITITYKRASWGDWHTGNDGDGLWLGDKQILGTCQFTVSGCETEKSARAKIRRYVVNTFPEIADAD